MKRGQAGNGQIVNGCLAIGTVVESPAGAKAVEQLKVRDQVWGYHVDRHEPVVAVIQSLVPTKAHETVRFGRLRVTRDHPLYVEGQWKPAGKVEAQDLLLTNSLTEQEAGSPQIAREEIDVYDVTVDGPHNFFAGGVLVHNKSLK